MAEPSIDWGTNVPLYDPSGTLRAVPQEQVKVALQDPGVKRAIPMVDPQGIHHWIHEDEVQPAVAAGGKISFPSKEIPKWFGFTPGNVASNIWSGAKGVVTGAYDLGKDLVNNPNWFEGSGSTYNKFVGAPSEDQVVKAGESLQAGHRVEAFGHGLASAVPLVGPWAASLGEQAGQGDIGGAAGQFAGAAAGTKAMATAVNAVGNAPEAARSLAQKTLNIGPEQTAKSLIPYQKELVKINESNTAKLEENQQATKNLNDRFQERVDKIKNVQAEKIGNWRQRVDEINQANADDIAQWKETTKAVNDINQARVSQVAERTQLGSEIGQSGTKLATGLKDLEAQVRAEGGAKFEQLYEATKGIQADPAKLPATIQGAMKYLSTPENERMFDKIVGEVGQNTEMDSIARNLGYANAEDAIAKVGENTFNKWADSQAVAGTSRGYPEMHGLYKQFGRILGTRDLPGEVYQALKHTQRGVAAEMANIATQAGPEAAGLDTGARSFWREYENAFNDMRAVSQGGSPLARAYRAVDPDYAVAPFIGKAGVRAISQLGKYSPDLAQLARETVSKYNHMQSLPKNFSAKALPEQPLAKPTPPPPLVQHGPFPQGPEPLPPPELQAYPRFDPRDAKMQIVNKIAEHARSDTGWGLFADIGAMTGAGLGLLEGHLPAAGALAFPIARRMFGGLLQRPSFQEWLTQPKPSEYRAAAAATSPMQMKNVNDIMQAAKEGRISPGEADRRIRLLGQNTKIKRPTPPR